MRILDNSTARLDLTDLGFSEGNFERYSRSFTKPYGMILVTGPTGSGKSTTLYATLNIVSRPEVNVITVEDPVEYRLPGINQVQTNTKAGLTFASALRSILRSDPDIVLIGEIRDHETGQIAVEAALTGHLVLSTLHTNDAPSAVTRLTEMGIEPFLVGSALDAVLAQRLARRLCTQVQGGLHADTGSSWCRRGSRGTDDKPLPELYRAVGCPACAKTGYKGRLALHEVMIVSEEIERLAVERASATVIAQVARDEGMGTLRDDGLDKVARRRHLARRDPARRRLKAWQGRPSRSRRRAGSADSSPSTGVLALTRAAEREGSARGDVRIPAGPERARGLRRHAGARSRARGAGRPGLDLLLRGRARSATEPPADAASGGGSAYRATGAGGDVRGEPAGVRHAGVARTRTRRSRRRPAAGFEVPAAAFEPVPAPTAAFEAPALEPANGQVYDLAPSAARPHACRRRLRRSCRSSSRRSRRPRLVGASRC